MKKLLLSLLALGMLHSAIAQTWCPPGAKWSFKRGAPYSNSGVNGDMELAYASDVTIMGIPCKKLTATFMGTTNGPGSPIVVQSFNTYYTYQSNNVIFLYNTTNAFDTLVNFNALPGDKWLRAGAPAQAGGCNSRRAFTVTDTGHVTINGFYLKTITTTYTSSVNYGQGPITFTVGDVFIERIFFSSVGYGNYNLFPTYCEIDNMIAEIPNTQFRCYQDSIFPVYNPSNNGCRDLWTSLKTRNGSQVNISVYPNPANDLLTIELPDARTYELRLSDLLGHSWPLEVSATSNVKTQADISSFSPGIYFLRVYENGKPVSVEKLVKE